MDNGNTLKLTIESWAELVIKSWVQMAKTLEIHPDDPLTDDRFKYFLTVQADGDVERITFTYDYYLKFVNWGVGRGVPIKDRDTFIAAGMTKRRKKPWYDDVFPVKLAFLGHQLSERFAQRTVALVKSGLEIQPSGENGSGLNKPVSTPSTTTKKGISYSQFRKNRSEQGW